MKKTYESVMLECVTLSEEDILTTSEGLQKTRAFDTPYDAF